MYLLNYFLDGIDIDEIMPRHFHPDSPRKKLTRIKEAIKSRLEISPIILIRLSLSMMYGISCLLEKSSSLSISI